jgi:hypothetical protein
MVMKKPDLTGLNIFSGLIKTKYFPQTGNNQMTAFMIIACL